MEKNTDRKQLYEAVLSLKNEDECSRFFEDVCTIKELEAMAQRLEVAKMLSGGVTFNEIVAKTGASTTTISRVNRCLRYGGGGYDAVLARIKK